MKRTAFSTQILKILSRTGMPSEELAEILLKWWKHDEKNIREILKDLHHSEDEIEKSITKLNGKLKPKISIKSFITMDQTNTNLLPAAFTGQLIQRLQAAGQKDLSAIAASLKTVYLKAPEVADAIKTANAASASDTLEALLKGGYTYQDSIQTMIDVWKADTTTIVGFLKQTGHDAQSIVNTLTGVVKEDTQALQNLVQKEFQVVAQVADSVAKAVGSEVKTAEKAATDIWHNVENWF